MFHTGQHYDFNVAELFFQLAKAKNEYDLVNGDLVTNFVRSRRAAEAGLTAASSS
jgi:hypothetical protein